MGWKGYETTINIGMLFRKMYCSNCGTRLEKEKVVNLYYKGDPAFKKHSLGFGLIGMDKIQKNITFINVQSVERPQHIMNK